MENSREKQIEEMAKVIDQSKYNMCITKEHPSITVKYHSKKIAEAVYTAGYRKQIQPVETPIEQDGLEYMLNSLGYRKQSEGEWIGEGDGYADGELVYDVWHCSECDHCIDDGTDDVDLLPNFCPNCGAKMKGA